MPNLKPAKFADEHIAAAVNGKYGEALAESLSMKYPDRGHCKDLPKSCSIPLTTAENLIRRKLFHHKPWGEIAAAHFKVVCTYHSSDDETERDWVEIFDSQKTLFSTYSEWFRSENTAWSLPVLYEVCRDLINFARQADNQLESRGEKTGKLTEAARLLQVGFGLCCSDRSSSGDSKKTGVIFMASSLFKTYFRLRSIALCKNVIRGVDNAGLLGGLPIPMSHWVTYRYYMGVLCFLQEDYDKAEDHLYFSFYNCHRNNPRHRELILNFLIPLKLLKNKRPIESYLQRFGRLTEIYEPFIQAVKFGNIEKFDEHMLKVEKVLMKRGTYLVVERCREACLCNLVKLIQRLKSGAHQIPLESFKKIAYEVDEDELSNEPNSKLEEVECVLANLIAQDRVRGYIHHQAKMLVLSKIDAFPIQNSIKVC